MDDNHQCCDTKARAHVDVRALDDWVHDVREVNLLPGVQRDHVQSDEVAQLCEREQSVQVEQEWSDVGLDCTEDSNDELRKVVDEHREESSPTFEQVLQNDLDHEELSGDHPREGADEDQASVPEDVHPEVDENRCEDDQD